MSDLLFWTEFTPASPPAQLYYWSRDLMNAAAVGCATAAAAAEPCRLSFIASRRRIRLSLTFPFNSRDQAGKHLPTTSRSVSWVVRWSVVGGVADTDCAALLHLGSSLSFMRTIMSVSQQFSAERFLCPQFPSVATACWTTFLVED